MTDSILQNYVQVFMFPKIESNLHYSVPRNIFHKTIVSQPIQKGAEDYVRSHVDDFDLNDFGVGRSMLSETDDDLWDEIAEKVLFMSDLTREQFAEKLQNPDIANDDDECVPGLPGDHP